LYEEIRDDYPNYESGELETLFLFLDLERPSSPIGVVILFDFIVRVIENEFQIQVKKRAQLSALLFEAKFI